MNGILYQSTDSGAPVLSRTKGSLITVLKACLVNGYGSMPSLGYTVPFEDAPNNVCVFRQPSGTKMYLQVSDNAPGNLYNKALVQSFKTMSSAYLGIEPCPFVSPTTGNIPYIIKDITTSQNANSIPWYLIGDDKGFWLITLISSYVAGVQGNATSQHYFGDYIPFDITNVYNYCMICPNGSSYNYYTTLGSVGAFPQFVLRDIPFSFGSVYAGMFCPIQPTYMGVVYFTGYSNTNGFSTINGRFIGNPVYIQTANAILGILPGIQQPFFEFPLNYTIQPSDIQPTIYSDGDNQQLSFSPGYYGNLGQRYYTGLILINSGSKFRYVY